MRWGLAKYTIRLTAVPVPVSWDGRKKRRRALLLEWPQRCYQESVSEKGRENGSGIVRGRMPY